MLIVLTMKLIVTTMQKLHAEVCGLNKGAGGAPWRQNLCFDSVD